MAKVKAKGSIFCAVPEEVLGEEEEVDPRADLVQHRTHRSIERPTCQIQRFACFLDFLQRRGQPPSLVAHCIEPMRTRRRADR